MSALPNELDAGTRFSAYAAVVIAALVAIASVGGIGLDATYAHETPSWRVQAIGQDWANLVVAVPWLVVAAMLVLRGSRRARFLLGGALVYCVYSYAMYALDVAFNALFLIYCGALGLASFGLAGLASDLRGSAIWFTARAPRRAIGAFAMICAGAFALMWLSQIVPAVVAGTQPVGLAETGLVTNPVHVLDLSLVLPAMFIGGVLLWRRHPLGFAIAPVMLAFGVLMAASLVAMAGALTLGGLATGFAPTIGFAAFALVQVAALVWLLAAVTRE